MNQPNKERFKTSVGGQALMEGVMMRGPERICCAVRKPDGTIETKIDPVKHHGVWTKIPLVRGAISMIESLIVGYRYMMYSAQVSMGDDYDPAEEETAFEKWVGEHLGEKAENALLAVAACWRSCCSRCCPPSSWAAWTTLWRWAAGARWCWKHCSKWASSWPTWWASLT